MDGFARLLDATARCLSRYENVVADRPVLAAVSGGADSTMLALVLARLHGERRLPGPLHLCHIDHATRPDSRATAQYVVDLADRLDVPVHVHRLAECRGRPSEDLLRQGRYRALLGQASQLRAGVLLTGHHADDNLETVLFRMLRGTGPRGLAGIPEARWLCGQDGSRLLLVRPFLAVRRATLTSVLHHLGEPHHEDSTNQDLGYSRNRLRLETIPELRATLGVSLDVALMTVARTARAAAEIVEAQGHRLLAERARRRTAWRLELDLRQLDNAARPFVEEALRQAHLRLHPRGEAPLRQWLQRAMALLDQSDGKRLHGPNGLLLERTRDGLLLVDPTRAGAPPRPDDPGQRFAWDSGRERFGATEWLVEGVEYPNPPLHPSPTEAGPFRALLDPRLLPVPWRLRTRRPGDRFQPLGMDRDLDLRHYLKNRHVPRFDRDRLPLLVDRDDRILWIPGVALSELARLHLNTRRTIEVRATVG